MSDLVKRLRVLQDDLPYSDIEFAADRIEDLERELAAEKALADRLAAQLQGWWDCSDTFPWRDHEDREALEAYRKARGL